MTAIEQMRMAALVALSVSCRSGDADRAGSSTMKIVDTWRRLAEEMCRCTDQACGQALLHRMEAMREQLDVIGSPIEKRTLTPEEHAALDEISAAGEKLGTCLTKAMTGR